MLPLDDPGFTKKLTAYLADVSMRLAEFDSSHVGGETIRGELFPIFAELSTSLEELSTAESELRRQNQIIFDTRAEVEAERQRYRELFDFAPDAYLVTDRHGVITEANLASTRLLGADRWQMIGRPLAGFVPARDRSSFRSFLNKISQEPPPEEVVPLTLLGRSGVTIDAEIRVGAGSSPPSSDPIIRWLIRDVTERKRLEDQVRQANVELEQRIADRTAALTAANDLKERILVAEQEARQRAEDLQRTSAFLAEAGVLLSESLDLEHTLNALARLLTERFADWCAVYSSDAAGLSMVAGSHRDPAKLALVEDLGRFEIRPDAEIGLMEVLESGNPIFREQVRDESLVRAASGPEHLAALRALGVSSLILLPLRARGETLGVISMGTVGDRRFQESDVEFAVEIARRAGVAVDNARLYRLAQMQLMERKRTEEFARDLNRKLQRAMTETHHRVKNNLQLITGMIDMRLLDENETVSVEDMRRLANQISILARVHDLLTSRPESDPSASVPVEPVLDALLAMLTRAAVGRTIVYKVENVELPSKQLSALALVVNELVSNALKYSRGEVEVSLNVSREAGPEQVRVEVCDDGRGFPPGFDPVDSASTGLELVQTLSRWDLNGNVDFTNRPEGGARVVLRFIVAS